MATALVRVPKIRGMKKGKRIKVRKICITTVKFLRREMRALQSVGRAFQKYVWGKKDDAEHYAGAGGAAPV